MANINKIRLSGQTYNIEDSNAPKTVELTQAQYDALAVKDPNTFYIITDAQGADLSQYYTSAQTESAITQAVSGKQDTLVSGTNIKTINNESILGSGNIDIQGGGSSYTAGDGIDITNDVISVTGKVDTSTYETYTAATATAIGNKLATSDFNTYSGTVDTAINSKASQSDLSTLSGTVTAHTANTDIHVTTAQTAAWNAKSDFSGSYNDLTDKPTIPTVPTSNTAFTNDAGYITSDAISGKADTSAVTESINAAVSGKVDTSTFNTYSGSVDTALSGKQDTLSAGTNITIVDNVISATGGGGGKAVSGGTNISITTGETADTINCKIPYYKDGGNCWTIYGYNDSYYANSSTKAEYSAYIGLRNVINNTSYSRYTRNNIIIGFDNKLESNYTEYYMGGNIIIGENNTLSGANNIRESYVIGKNNKGYGIQEFICGWNNEARNTYETSFGYRNISTSGVSTFGYSGNTLFSIGNGYYFGSDRHNAFEIRQNGDIYIADTNDTSTTNYYQKPMIKLQDALGGTVDTEITSASTNPVTSAAIYNQFGGLKLVKLTQSEYDALSTKDNSTLYVIVN